LIKKQILRFAQDDKNARNQLLRRLDTESNLGKSDNADVKFVQRTAARPGHYLGIRSWPPQFRQNIHVEQPSRHSPGDPSQSRSSKPAPKPRTGLEILVAMPTPRFLSEWVRSVKILFDSNSWWLVAEFLL